MAVESYTLEFDGYWREANIAGLPASSGVYCVYACKYNAHSGSVSIRELLYIGESQNIRERVEGHERWDDWRSELQLGEVLCFNAALISPKSDRERAEAAMIYKHKPPCNVEYVNHFPFDTTSIQTKGRNCLLSTKFTVYRTP